MGYSNCWKPVHITHVSDDDNPARTLCGVSTEGYEWGGEVEDSTDGAMFSCEKCKRALEKRERKATPERAGRE
jgi:hypothetical protein